MIGYMCKVAFDYHLEDDPNGSKVYPTLEDLLRERPCVKGCGYVSVTVKLDRILSEGKI